ncbi:DUF6894 family protein [Methylobacterium sp. D53M]
MPRYFFDIHDGQLQRDEDGTEAPISTLRAEKR